MFFLSIMQHHQGSLMYSAAGQWPKHTARVIKKRIAFSNKKSKESSTEPWSQHHGERLGLHVETEAAEMLKSNKELWKIFKDATYQLKKNIVLLFKNGLHASYVIVFSVPETTRLPLTAMQFMLYHRELGYVAEWCRKQVNGNNH